MTAQQRSSATDGSPPGPPGAVLRCPLSGCDATPTVFSRATKSTDPNLAQSPEQVVVDDTSVYWTDADRTVVKCAKTGCVTPEVLASQQVSRGALAVDGANVYWFADTYAGGPKVLRRCAKSGCGGMPTTLAMRNALPGVLAVDATSVYWTRSIASKAAS